VGTTGTPLPDSKILGDLGAWFAAGYFEEPDACPMRRWSRAVRRRFERGKLSGYEGGWLYPRGEIAREDGPAARIVVPSYSFTWTFNPEALRAAMVLATPEQITVLQNLEVAMSDLAQRTAVWRSPHTVGGCGYTHSIPNYGRVLREGLDAHAGRVEASLDAARMANDEAKVSFYLGLLDVLAGIRAWHLRIVQLVGDWQPSVPGDAQDRDLLLEALRQVPFGPARSFYEAVVAYNFTFYVDDCDNPGRLDRELAPYYERDTEAGVLTRQRALALLRAFTDNVAANHAWSAAVGGSNPDGTPAYNEVTRLCLEAVHHRHRPSYELGVRRDMPDAVWSAALDAVATGCGQPAFYNDTAYVTGLREADLGLSDEDVVLWNGGGCTETMIHGCSNVGSLDAGIHLPLILETTLQQHLPRITAFDALLQQFMADVDNVVDDITGGVNRLQKAKAAQTPQPVRSLLVDDCIDRGTEFNAGGARYNWSVVNVAGLANVTDSLAAVREVVFDKQELSGSALISAVSSNFEGLEPLRQRLRCCPRFGNDLPEVDTLAAEIAEHVFQAFRRRSPWRGGRFLPACIMFTTYAVEGARIGATPDGRRAGEPLADSIGPVAGRDHQGPTAMLRSVTSLPLQLALGTPVLNIRFGKALFAADEGRRAIRDLITTYFDLGGMQIQLSVVDRDVLEAAIREPEQHEDLIVRVGGFSAYFNSLSPALKQAILERTEHTF
jgi:pyruvate-formate lyase